MRDGLEALKELEGRTLEGDLKRAATLLATVIGQDIEQRADGVFRIARRTAPDRVISTVDPEARHGHKSQARGFDGYKGHLAIDPDSEIITAAEVGPANGADGALLPELLAEFTPAESPADEGVAALEQEADPAQDGADHREEPPAPAGGETSGEATPAPAESATATGQAPAPVVYGDSAYGSGTSLAYLDEIGASAMTKVQPPIAPGGHFPKDRFAIDLTEATVTCPNGVVVPLRPLNDGGGLARFGAACADCPLRTRCTSSKEGRAITIKPSRGTARRGAGGAAGSRLEGRLQPPGWSARSAT